MLALLAADVKDFMNRLLREETFDGYAVRTVELRSYARFTVDVQKEDGEVLWESIRPHVFQWIKGKNRPRKLHLVLSASETMAEGVGMDAALFLNILYEGDQIKMTTGCAPKTFSLDRQAENRWDAYILQDLKEKGVGFSRQV